MTWRLWQSMKLSLASSFLWFAFVTGCSSHHSTGTTTDMAQAPVEADMAVPPESGAGADATVTIFDNRLFAFDNSGNTREGTATVDLPNSGTYAKITLHIALACPTKGCDP